MRGHYPRPMRRALNAANHAIDRDYRTLLSQSHAERSVWEYLSTTPVPPGYWQGRRIVQAALRRGAAHAHARSLEIRDGEYVNPALRELDRLTR